MTTRTVAEALERVRTVLARRPDMGMHEDAPASSRWTGGTACVTTHANGTAIVTDMPAELGGGGAHVTPGFLFRAGVASCTATRIAMAAALEGIVLTRLEVDVKSRSDTRGLLGLPGEDGAEIGAGPSDLAICVRIGARGVAGERLQQIVRDSCTRSPITCAAREANDLAVSIDVVDA